MKPIQLRPVIITLNQIISHNLQEKILSTHSNFIISAPYPPPSTFVKQLQNKPNILLLSPYQAIIDMAHSESPQGLTLLIGNMEKQESMNKCITVDELCTLLPQKVPLSYRPKCENDFKMEIEARVGQVDRVKRMLLVGKVCMWDEAYQIILDYLPSPLYIPYEFERSHGDYQLGGNDFIEGLNAIHKRLNNAVKNQPELVVKKQNCEQYVKWMVDRFRLKGEVNALEDDRKLVDIL